MKTTIRFNRLATAKCEVAAFICLTLGVAGCKREAAAPSAEKAMMRTADAESMEIVRSDSGPSYLARVRTEKWPEPQKDRAENGERQMPIENRAESAASEGEERLPVEEITTAQPNSVLTVQRKNREEAERAFELASQRYNAGTGTQIDFLNAQTAVVKARCSYVDALQDYAVARGILSRATGADLQH